MFWTGIMTDLYDIKKMKKGGKGKKKKCFKLDSKNNKHEN